ncbi:Smr/MutS family protein [Desulforapulum autotrophicum]|nr:Smr/MutS family protein [Desulforapulum autotrophicum]
MKKQLNRNGIPVFDRGEDLFFMFKEMSEAGLPATDQSCEQIPDTVSAVEPEPGSRQKSNPNDRNGLPILSRSTSLSRLFATKAQKIEDDEDFPSLLERSLRGKNGAALLRDKREKDFPEPVPLKKQLKRYPPPEEELDLHGDPAIRAVVRSESFVRTAWRAGEFTVSIVVGKGLHSEFGAVLPDVVEDLLVRLKKEGIVLWFEWDRKFKSRSGAVIVYLKQR